MRNYNRHILKQSTLMAVLGTAAGKFWFGNFCRSRRWDAYYGKCTPRAGSHNEFTRRYTRYSVWNKDPAAFGKLQFVE